MAIKSHASELIGTIAGAVLATAGWLVSVYRSRTEEMQGAQQESVDTRLRAIVDDVRMAQEDTDINEDEIRSLRIRIDRVETDVARLGERDDRMQATLQAMQTDLERLEASKLSTREFERSISDLKKHVDTRFDDLKEILR